MKKAGLIIVGIVLFLIIIFFSLSILNQQTDYYALKGIRPSEAPMGPSIASNARPLEKQPLENSLTSNNNQGKISIEDQLVKELKKLYSDSISDKSTQAILLKVRDYVLSIYPKDGEKRFYDILKRAFPELADDIMITLKKLDKYNRWLKENELQLAEMNELEKKGTIWEKRKELFGDDADEIWSDEVYAYEERKQTMKDTMSLLDESYDTTIDEKLDIYMSTLNETYEDTPESYFLLNGGLLSKVFFGIDSVQKEFKEMDPDQRQMKINKIRREMGFTQAQIEDHEKMDVYRNQRWNNGLKYMEERDQLAAEYDGPELEEKLVPLREKYFKHEAETFRLEENDGFFRYKRPRVYGRN